MGKYALFFTFMKDLYIIGTLDSQQQQDGENDCG